MKNLKRLLFIFAMSFSIVFIACEEDTDECTGCSDDAPYGTIEGGCYATLSECEDNESGNCTICQ